MLRITGYTALILLLACCACASSASADWQAGAARVSITPEDSMWMSGYGGRDHTSEGKLTDLWAKAVVLQDPAGNRIAAVSLDLVGLDRETELAIRNEVAASTGIPVANCALFSSHTHTGPVVGTNLKAMFSITDEQWTQIHAYTAQLIENVVTIVEQAVEDLEPADLSWANGHTTFAVNRRNNREPDVPMLREQGLLQGPVDHDVPVLAVRTPAGLKESGIDYVHLKALGTPPAGREAARKGRMAEMERLYEEQLETPEAGAEAARMIALAEEAPSALLCFERDPAHCHRTPLRESAMPDWEAVDLYA
jgi:hypothetical protein